MKNKKTRIVVLTIIIILFVVTVGITFAYFTSNVLGDGTSNATVKTENVAQLKFENDDDLSIDATMSNFVSNGEDLSDTITATATLTSESAYSDSYYIYFNISENDFEYTQNDDTAELILAVTGPDGEPVTSLGDLELVTSDSGITGFDITTATGIFSVADAYEISTTYSDLEVSQDWTFTLYFINLDANQNDNAGKTFESEIIMQAEEYVETTLASTISNLVGTVQGTGYLVDENGYRYEGDDPNNYITFNEESWRIIGVFDTEVANEDGSTTTESLVKIVRAESIGVYAWETDYGDYADYAGSNWPTSSLYTYLNGSYYDSIDSSYVENVVWELGGIDNGYNLTVSEFYNAERGINGYSVYGENATTTTGYIGLIYMSDYGYAVLENSCSRSLTLDNYSNCSDNNWLYTNTNFWTIVPWSTSDAYVVTVSTVGVAFSYVYSYNGYNGYAVLPVIYLKSEVEFTSGDGSASNPYILSA